MPVRKFRILSSSRTLATVSPTRLDSKYFSGSANKCRNNLKLSITSIRLVVCVKRSFRKSQNKLVNVNYPDTNCKHVQRRHTAMHKHFINDNLSHYRRQDSQNLHRKNGYQNLYKFLLNLSIVGINHLKLKSPLCPQCLFADNNRRTVPYLRKLLAGFYFRLSFIRE